MPANAPLRGTAASQNWMELVNLDGASAMYLMLMHWTRPATLALCERTLGMELVKIRPRKDVRNAPKGLSSEFHQIRSHTNTTLLHKTANRTDPLLSRTRLVSSIAAPLASLAPLR